jgi:tagatose 6-phosphate kinase
MMLCLGTTPAVQRVMVFPHLATGEVNRATRTFEGVAGKSLNVAKVLHALGQRVVALGFVGGERGAFIERSLDSRGIGHDFVRVDPSTRQCITLLDEATGTVTELVEESEAVEAHAYDELLACLRRHLEGSRALVLSGTVATGGPSDLYARAVTWARAADILAVVDASGLALEQSLEARPDVVKPNRLELAATVGRGLPDEAAVQAAMRELGERGAGHVVVTAGRQPTLAFDGHGFWRIAVPAVKAVNPIGSGDAFTAALVWRLGRGDDLGEACRWGSAAGAANALTLLAGELEPADVERLVTGIQAERL